MSNLAYKWALLYARLLTHMGNDSFILMHDTTYAYVTLYKKESPRIARHESISPLRKLNLVTHIWVISDMNESLPIWNEWVISHINGSFLISTHHLSYEELILPKYESSLTWINHFPYEWVISHINGPFRILTHHLSYEELMRGGGLGSRPKKIYGERLGDGVEYHFMKTTPRR